jgi:osmotically-inducible protein OsmY
MSTDHSIKTEVLAELAWEPMVNADHLGVTVRDGIVTLTGHVESYWQKRAAEKSASRVKGVKAIAQEIEVRLPVHIKRSDEDIAAAAVNRMSWDGAIPVDAVMVSVTDGVVTLTGNVDHAYQRIAALWAVQSLWGVRDVDNQIAVLGPMKKPVDPNQISDDIRRALNRGWFAADTVHVRANGGTVTLSGSAETLRDRNLAVSTAWAAPGTTTVENHIRIG